MREIVERILEIEKEQARRKTDDPLLKYNTGDKVHLKQMAFHRCITSFLDME